MILEVKELDLTDNDDIELGVFYYWKYNTKQSKHIDLQIIKSIEIYVENNTLFNNNMCRFEMGSIGLILKIKAALYSDSTREMNY